MKKTYLFILCLSTGLSAPYTRAQSNQYITQSQVNQPGGVAGLDTNSNLTNNIITSGITGLRPSSDPRISLPMFHLPMGSKGSQFITLGQEHVSIGGWKDNSGNTVSSGLIVQGNPYGNWSMGCVLCIGDGPDNFGQGGLQFPLSGIDPRSGSGAVVNGDAATATVSILQNHRHIRFALPIASFDAQGAILKTPLTPAQIAQIPQNMYVSTNLLDSANSQPNAPATYLDNRFRGQVSSVTPTRINVYAWASQRGPSASGQIPDVTKFDLIHNPGSTQAMLYVGGSGENETMNIYDAIDAANIYTQNPIEESAFEAGIEWDANARNFTPLQPYTRQFLTIADSCTAPGGGGCPDGTETDQSHGILIQSNMLPRLYQARGRWWGYEFDGSGASLFGNGPVGTTIGNQKAMAAFHTLGQGGSGIDNVVVISTEKHSKNYGDWRDDELRIGGYTQPSITYGANGFNAANPMGVLAFNHKLSNGTTLYGSTCILGFGVTDGMCIEGNGDMNVYKGLKMAPGQPIIGLALVNNQLHSGATLYSTPTGDWLVGTQIGGGGNLRGVVGYYGQTMSLSGNVSAAQFTENLTTPSSSSAACAPGQFTDDANYHYVCTAPNRWKRVALSDF